MAVGAYPGWWKARYGEDQLSFIADLRAEERSVLRVLPNLIIGAAKARLFGTGAPPLPSTWFSRTRAAVGVSTLPAMLLLPLMVVATSRGYYANGDAVLSACGRVAEDAGQVMFVALLVTILALCSGWRVLLNRARQVPRGVARLRYEAALMAPALALGAGLGLSTLRDRLGVPKIVGSDWAWSPRRHAYYDISIHWSPGHPLLAAVLHSAALVCGFGGWMLAVVAIGRASRRVPATGESLRSGVVVAGVVAVSTAVLATAFAVYDLAIVLQPWHLVRSASASCLPLAPPPVLRAVAGCGSLGAPAGHALLTSPVAGLAALWITAALACAVMSAVGARTAARCLRSAVALGA